MRLVVSCWLLVVGCLLLVSCAKKVTEIVTYGSEMLVEVTLRGTVEVNSNRYFLILSSSSSYSFPLPPPDVADREFIEPGTEPRSGYGSIESYYSSYYSTWSGYVFLSPSGYELVKGPFVQGQTATRESLLPLTEVSSTLKFNFRLEKIFGSSIPDYIYFNFVSVAWPNDKEKLSQDYLSTTNPYVYKGQYSSVTISDDENTSLNSALDILSCKVTIQ